MDLVDDAPGPVLRQIIADRADRARELLESVGATVTDCTASPGPNASTESG
jgi:ribosomal protein L7/L12